MATTVKSNASRPGARTSEVGYVTGALGAVGMGMISVGYEFLRGDTVCECVGAPLAKAVFAS